jgi:hypothetical protein
MRQLAARRPLVGPAGPAVEEHDTLVRRLPTRRGSNHRGGHPGRRSKGDRPLSIQRGCKFISVHGASHAAQFPSSILAPALTQVERGLGWMSPCRRSFACRAGCTENHGFHRRLRSPARARAGGDRTRPVLVPAWRASEMPRRTRQRAGRPVEARRLRDESTPDQQPEPPLAFIVSPGRGPGNSRRPRTVGPLLRPTRRAGTGARGEDWKV